MGCCASINKPPSASHTKQNTPPPTQHPLREQETVKQVLTETPNPVTTTTTKPNIQQQQQHYNKNNSNNVYNKPITKQVSEEVSEIGITHSESVSTLTTEKTNNDDHEDDDSEVRQTSPAKFQNRSVYGKLSREKIMGKSQGRSSPGRVKIVQRRETVGYVADGQRGKSGSGSVWRSMSPRTRADSVGTRTGLGRNPSLRKSGKCPGRVGSELAGNNRKVEEVNRENKWPMTSNESLENPLVSLECFIFL